MEDIDDPMSDDEMVEERVKGTDDKTKEGNVILLAIMIMIMINVINRTR